MILWVGMAALLLAALIFIVWPLYRSSGGLTPLLAGAIVVVVSISAAMYHHTGEPGVPSGAGTVPNADEMVGSLEQRLQSQPDNIDGWLMLGRSYQAMQRFDESVAAFEKAIALEDGKNAQTLVSLAVVLIESEGGVVNARATGLLENTLAIEPNNPNALFYSGFSAAQRGDKSLAADRWEMLLGLNAPPEIQELLQQKINEWRGLPNQPAALSEKLSSTVDVSVSLSADAAADLPGNATVFLIARDPAQPSPPIAVARRTLSELPIVISLSDRDAMVPGRNLSAFAEFELVARVSRSGQPIAQTGDWYGAVLHDASDAAAVRLLIDTKVSGE
ncbi:MAG: tetratricopeptide repeat protein [Gammaproteobacteria bacterium]|nr:tetratricopeptide repeat protein [Gammaproteobacteria bacterium]